VQLSVDSVGQGAWSIAICIRLEPNAVFLCLCAKEGGVEGSQMKFTVFAACHLHQQFPQVPLWYGSSNRAASQATDDHNSEKSHHVGSQASWSCR